MIHEEAALDNGNRPSLPAKRTFCTPLEVFAVVIQTKNYETLTAIASSASADLVCSLSRTGNLRGSLYVLFLNANGTAKSVQKIVHNTGGGPTLANGDRFGDTVTNLGDHDGDGVTDLAVGATRAAPEPSTWALLMVAGIGGKFARRRRSSSESQKLSSA